MVFADRAAAGRRLADRLAGYAGRSDVVVLGLPRGGVPVAYQVAVALGVTLDVFVVRKVGTPGRPELAMGAVATGGVRVSNDEVRRRLAISDADFGLAAAVALGQLDSQERAYRGDRPPPVLAGRVAILVDDGLATGSTMRAAVIAARQQDPQRVVVAVPVAPAPVCAAFAAAGVDTVCVEQPADFVAVGLHYQNFEPTSEQEVRLLLAG